MENRAKIYIDYVDIYDTISFSRNILDMYFIFIDCYFAIFYSFIRLVSILFHHVVDRIDRLLQTNFRFRVLNTHRESKK